MTTLLVGVNAAAATAASSGAGSTRPGFSAQAEALGLSGPEAARLQQRADAYLARTPGIQVAVNEIALEDGGVLLLALPGEKRARDLSTSEVGGAALSCPYTYVCAYSDPDFTGDALFLFTCDRRNPIIWAGTGSWINNQRSTLYARFYDVNGNVGWTSPGGYSEDRAAPWGWVHWLSPC
ncbi:peptidase inhibitor family I36 protein [Streptomyces capparidis]